MKARVFKDKNSILVVCLGFLAAAVPYWPIPYDEIQMTATPFVLKWAVGSFATGVLATSFLKGDVLSSSINVLFGFLLAVIARIVFDCIQDPTNHNLWPVEVMVTAVVAFPSAWVGALVGSFLKNRIQSKD